MSTPRWPYVQKLPSGKFRGWYRVGDRKRFLPARVTAQQASEDAIEMRKQIRDGGPALAMTIDDLATRFLEDVRRTRTHGTWDFYSVQLAGVFRVLDRAALLASVTGEDMRHLIDTHHAGKFSTQTIGHRRAVLRRMFRWGKKAGLCANDPTAMVDWPTPEQSTFDAIDSAKMGEHLQAIRAKNEQDHDLIAFTLYTGLRRAELARLRCADVDTKNGLVWIRGKRRSQYAPIVEQVRECADRMLRDAAGREFVVRESENYRGPKPGGKLKPEEIAQRRRVYTIANTFRRWSGRLDDRRMHPHAMRHTLATELVRSGVERGTVGQMLRHRQTQTTERYVHLVRDDLRQAMAKLNIAPKDHG